MTKIYWKSINITQCFAWCLLYTQSFSIILFIIYSADEFKFSISAFCWHEDIISNSSFKSGQCSIYGRLSMALHLIWSCLEKAFIWDWFKSEKSEGCRPSQRILGTASDSAHHVVVKEPKRYTHIISIPYGSASTNAKIGIPVFFHNLQVYNIFGDGYKSDFWEINTLLKFIDLNIV